jgi:hypothetical protein
MDDPPAAGALEDVPADVPEEVLDDDALEEVEEDDEHPPISAAITATATPHAAKRVRSSLDMVLIALLSGERPREPIHVGSR